jgi:hypothetical protein
MVPAVGVQRGGVGMNASVRGWLEADHRQRQAVEPVIAAAHRDLYSGGWAFPKLPFNWTLYVFYGGDIGKLSCRGYVSRLRAWPPCLPRTTTATCRSGCS